MDADVAESTRFSLLRRINGLTLNGMVEPSSRDQVFSHEGGP